MKNIALEIDVMETHKKLTCMCVCVVCVCFFVCVFVYIYYLRQIGKQVHNGLECIEN